MQTYILKCCMHCHDARTFQRRKSVCILNIDRIPIQPFCHTDTLAKQTKAHLARRKKLNLKDFVEKKILQRQKTFHKHSDSIKLCFSPSKTTKLIQDLRSAYMTITHGFQKGTYKRTFFIGQALCERNQA